MWFVLTTPVEPVRSANRSIQSNHPRQQPARTALGERELLVDGAVDD